MSTEKIKKYQSLYEEYNALIAKTTFYSNQIDSNQIDSNKKISISDVQAKDMIRRDDILKELILGLTFLTDNQLIDLSGDVFLSKKVLEILVKRKEVL